jgi:hypothetical protein
MEKKLVLKIVYLFLLIFLLNSFVSALEYRTNQYFYLNLTSNAKDERGNKDFTDCANPPTYSSSGADFELSSSQCINAGTSTELLSSGSKSFSYCMKVVPASLTATMVIYDEHQDSSGTGHILRIGDSGGGAYKFNLWWTGGSGYVGNAITAGSGYKICYSFNESNNENSLFVNSTTPVKAIGDVTDGTGTSIVHAARYSHTTAGYYDGIIVEFCGWRNTTTGKVLTESDVSTYLSYGCDGSPPAGDTTPPSITNILRNPSNISVFNLVANNLNINATITDDVKVKTVNITFKLNQTQIYVNGTLQNYNLTYSNSSSSGNVFRFPTLDEHNLLSAEYWSINPPGLFENTSHLNMTFSGTNNLIKIEFLKFRNNTQANLYEEMSINLTNVPSLTSWFYCNASYTTGNPSISSYCTLFASNLNNFIVNHTHGKSFHRIVEIPINTTTGKINNVKITPRSYIIKKASSTGEVIYYLNKSNGRTNSYQRSTNNGASYTSYPLESPDLHIHFLGNTPIRESINYCIRAEDSSGNKATPVCQSDVIDIPNLPPSEVTFYKPLYYGVYNTTLYINHSEAISPNLASIINYSYYYKQQNATEYIFIITQNDHNYNWDISGITDNVYMLKVIVSDSNRLTSTSYSDIFFINNPESLTDAYLMSIDSTLEDIYDLLEEVLNMLWLVILYLGLLYFSFWVVKSGNVYTGIAMLITTIGFDFYFVQKIYTDFVLPNVTDVTYIGKMSLIFGILLVLWIFAKIGFIVFSKYKFYSKQ